MPNQIRRTPLLGAIGFLLAATLGWGQAAKEQSPEVHEKYKGTATVLKNGKPIQVRASLSQMVVAGRQQITLPAHGFVLMQLRGGKLTVSIDGKEEHHVNGDFWVVPANAKVSIVATGETAILEMISLSVP